VITRRLLILMGAALVPALALQGYNQYELHRARDSDIRREVLEQSWRLAAEQQLVVDRMRNVLQGLVELPAIRMQNPADCLAQVNRLQPRFDGVAAIVVTNADGTTVCASDTDPPRQAASQIGDRPFFRQAMASGEFTVGGYTFGRRLRRHILPFAMAYRDAAGAPAGLVVAALDLGWLSRRLAGKQWNPHQAFVIADRDGLILVRHPDHDAFVGKQIPADIWGAASGAKEATNATLVSPLDKVTRIVGIIPPAIGPAGFYVSAGYDRDAAFANVGAVSWRGVVMVLAGMAIALLLAWYFGDRLIRRPIMTLVEATQRWRGGDLSARSGLHGETELGQLGESFDAMAADLQRALEYKDVLLRELSHRVMNSLQTLSSLFTLQARKLHDPEARGQLDQAVRRLQSVATAYRRLHLANGREVVDFAGFLDELAKDFNRSVMGLGQCTVQADPLLLLPDQAMPLALTVNELITNAIKHGTAESPITVKLGRSSEGWRIAVRNRGALPIGFDPSATSGFGMRMVIGMVKQIDGRLECSCMADETEFAVTFKATVAQPAPLSVIQGSAAKPA